MDDFGRDVALHKQAPVQLNQTQEELLQLQKVDAAGQLIDGIAHDLNNMLHIFLAVALSSMLLSTVHANEALARKNNCKTTSAMAAQEHGAMCPCHQIPRFPQLT